MVLNYRKTVNDRLGTTCKEGVFVSNKCNQ
jgi:hypothetical protein